MIVLLHPRAASPRSRRFPLSILSLAAVLEGREEFEIVDANVDPDPGGTLEALAQSKPIDAVAVSVMPGPQMVAAIPLCRRFREKFPRVPILWGGYFPSLFTDSTLNASYVDFAVRGQGEETFLEWLAAYRAGADYSRIPGLSFKDASGRPTHNPERRMRSPADFPWPPYHRLDASRYVLPTFLGSRTAVHQASIGCPYRCNFCGVITAYGNRELVEPAARTASILLHLKNHYRVNAIQFYDNNFFLREDHVLELAERIERLGMRWWCEGRVDIVLGFSDQTLRALKRAGSAMIFFGAESGSNWVLEQMDKGLKAEQTLELARRIKGHGIIPEFSFVIGNPHDPERDCRECLEFIRKIKAVNPESEIIVQHYIPTPQRVGMYGGIDDKIAFPSSPEEWATDRWYNFTVRKEPALPWLPNRVRRRIDDFETVVQSRWPTAQDIHLSPAGRALLKALASWRYSLRVYDFPYELQWAQRLLALRKPKLESL